MHRLSIYIDRPATREFKDTTAAIFDLLLEQAETGNEPYLEHWIMGVTFWQVFESLNAKHLDCRYEKLLLEEVRATVLALKNLSIPSQQRIIEKVYPKSRNDLESQIFRDLRSLTDSNWLFAWFLTILAENQDPDKPLGALRAERWLLNLLHSNKWSEREWYEWLSRRGVGKASTVLVDIEENPQKYALEFIPSAWIIGLPNGFMIKCADINRQQVFLESMRQQLSQLILYPELIGSLDCPFNAQLTAKDNPCCGFGHYLQGIWAGFRDYDKERYGLKPPSEVCLHHASIYPH
jgi:hypothetical protein